MLTRDTPWNNFINVELELLISRHDNTISFIAIPSEAEMPRPSSRMQHLKTYLFRDCSLSFSLLLVAPIRSIMLFPSA